MNNEKGNIFEYGNENLPATMGQMDFAEEKFAFQQDNYPKHCSKLVKEWLTSQIFGTIT